MTKFTTAVLLSHHGHLSGILVLSCLLLLLFCLRSRAAPLAHNFDGRCESCHLTNPQSGPPLIFTAPIDQLCSACHALNRTNSHPSGVPALSNIDPVFPLEDGTLLSCASCHAPCQTPPKLTDNMLRVPFDGITFCLRCHQPQETYTGRHVMAAGFVHAKRWTAPEPAHKNRLDPVSLVCLSCHDSALSASQPYAPSEPRLDVGHGSHPLGSDYLQLAASDDKLSSFDRLSGLVSLYEGKIGCASCHSPYATRSMHLVMDNRGSALCLECHLK